MNRVLCFTLWITGLLLVLVLSSCGDKTTNHYSVTGPTDDQIPPPPAMVELDTLVYIPALHELFFDHTTGDLEIDGHRCIMSFVARCYGRGNSLMLSGEVTFFEEPQDHTGGVYKFTKTSGRDTEILRLPYGYVLVTPPAPDPDETTQSGISIDTADHRPRTISFNEPSLFAQATVMLDSDRHDDVGSFSRIQELRFRAVTLRVRRPA
jgi:hypothetical protein